MIYRVWGLELTLKCATIRPKQIRKCNGVKLENAAVSRIPDVEVLEGRQDGERGSHRKARFCTQVVVAAGEGVAWCTQCAVRIQARIAASTNGRQSSPARSLAYETQRGGGRVGGAIGAVRA
jgi:hypothetical protein